MEPNMWDEQIMLLKDKFGIVTGAAGGMGRAAVALFAREGAGILCADIDGGGAANAAASVSSQGKQALHASLDVMRKAQCREVVNMAVRSFGRIDFLVHFAGIWDGRNTAEIEEEDWDRILNVNLKGSFLMCQAVAPVMVGQNYGRIVLIGSTTARVGGNVGGPHYAASKGGVAALGRALARMGRNNVTVNTINPGVIETAMTAGWPAATKAKLLDGIPLGRLGTPEDVAGPALFLISELAQWMTGETIEVNGGSYFA
jgi:NAD(P)-dependent dehydrogenase (short-subunit alcohol dehydrogenase family)